MGMASRYRSARVGAPSVRDGRQPPATSENYWSGTPQNPCSRASQNLTSAAPSSSGTADAGKAFATLQAQAALMGFRLDRIETDAGAQAFIVTRWALTKELATLDAVRDFLQQVGVANG